MRDWPFDIHQKVGTFWYRFRFWWPPPVRKYLKSFRKSYNRYTGVESRSNQDATNLYRTEGAPDFMSRSSNRAWATQGSQNGQKWRNITVFITIFTTSPWPTRFRPCTKRVKDVQRGTQYDCWVPEMFEQIGYQAAVYLLNISGSGLAPTCKEFSYI